MFDKKISIIHIKSGKFYVANVLKNKGIVKDMSEIEWDEDTFLDAFTFLKKKSKARSVRILLSEDYSYILGVPVPKNIEQEKEYVKENIREMIPEDLGDLVWDYKSYFKTKSFTAAQAFIILNSLFKAIKVAARKNRLKVEAIESISSSLARQTKDEEEPHIIIYNGVEPVGVVAFKGFVMASVRLGAEDDDKRISNLIKIIYEDYGIKPKKAVLYKAKLDENSKFKVEEKDLNPFIGLANKEDIKGKDVDVLNLDIF
jgi:hypothetical protein